MGESGFVPPPDRARIGWHGFFLLPILFILMLEAVRIVLSSLVHGEAVTLAVEMGDSVGSSPQTELDGVPDGDESAEEGADATDGSPADDGG